MKNLLVLIIALSSIFSNCLLFAGTVEESISKAKTAQQSGNVQLAADIMKTAIAEYPKSVDAHAEYGLYLSQLAGQSSLLKAGMLSNNAFEQFEKALELQPGHMYATLYRGILGVNVPKFMGKLKQAIKDLEFIRNKYGSNAKLYMTSNYYLGLGYLKDKQIEKAKESFKTVMMYGKKSDYYENAKNQYEKLSAESSTKSDSKKEEDNYQKAMGYLEEHKLNKAIKNFRIAAKQDTTNLQLYLIYARTLGDIASQGYDDSIAEDVTNRAALAHEVYEVLSHCVKLAHREDNILLLRASVAVNLPFFVNCLDDAVKDLTYLSKEGKTNKIKGEASYHLKRALERKKIFELAKIGYDAKSEEEKQKLLPQFISAENPIKQEKPDGKSLKIELTLGYRDEIAPQTAIWIEDNAGNYIKTIYVSGFVAHVKEKQMNLPRWAESSKFRNIKTVTGASIDCGKHLLYWDFTDFNGNLFKDKNFVLRAEICHWPHVQYANQSLEIDLNKSKSFHTEGHNFLIPELTASFIAN